VLGKIGFECYLAEGSSCLREFLSQLVSGKLCTARKARAIELWSGTAREGSIPGTWPQNLSAAAKLLDHRLHCVFARRFHHVKIVWLPGGLLEAKAYLAVYQKWVTPKELKDLPLADS
jgi:hypothetical protein